MSSSDRSSDHDHLRPFIGFIVNPVAGMGGSVGLKGTDGEAIVHEAVLRGARPIAGERAGEALKRLLAILPHIRVLTVAGPMGEVVAREAGIEPIVLNLSHTGSSKSLDTRLAAEGMAEQGVGLILFAGGDGTARDILGASGHRVPMLGVPAGVKMHSAVFGTTPANAGHVAALFLAGDPRALLREAEVMDLDEDAMRAGTLSAQLYGYARSPYERRLVQNAKAGSTPGENAMLDAVARQVASNMQDGKIYILGPGTTTRRVADAIGISSTLLGVDAVLNRKVVGADLDEQALLAVIEGHPAEILVGVLGGQGSLFGRGNQQISAEVIRRVGRNNIRVISSVEKLISLPTGVLSVDTGDAEINAMLTGHMPVITGPDRTMLVKIRA